MENPLLKYLALVKTVETGSFTRAAQALNYAQSSVSKMVADLEAKWGMTLLERSKRGVCLTSAGEQVLPFLRKVLNDHAELEGQICRMNGIETGVVRIGTFASVAIHWLPTLPGFDTMLLKQDEYKVVLPVGHPLAVHESVPIEALNGLPFLLLEHGGKTEVSDLLERAHVQPDVRFTTWEDFAIMAMAERGLGVGILPDLILRRIPYRIEIRPLANPYYRPIGLAVTPPPT